MGLDLVRSLNVDCFPSRFCSRERVYLALLGAVPIFVRVHVKGPGSGF